MKYWKTSIADVAMNPILRTYNLFKLHFKFRIYLEVVKDGRYRHALTKFRTCSHTLEWAWSTYQYWGQRSPLYILWRNRRCDDKDYERHCLFEIANCHHSKFRDLDEIEKFKYILMSEYPQILTWLSKLIYVGFKKKNDRSQNHNHTHNHNLHHNLSVA